MLVINFNQLKLCNWHNDVINLKLLHLRWKDVEDMDDIEEEKGPAAAVPFAPTDPLWPLTLLVFFLRGLSGFFWLFFCQYLFYFIFFFFFFFCFWGSASSVIWGLRYKSTGFHRRCSFISIDYSVRFVFSFNLNDFLNWLTPLDWGNLIYALVIWRLIGLQFFN